MSLEPLKSFSELPLSKPVLAAIEAAKYQTPTPVQSGTIPLILAGIDLIVQSQTGSGKTAAFAIPMVEMVDKNPGVIQALILAPTRELAVQVSEEVRRVGADEKGLSVVPVYGGASIRDQITAVKDAEIIVATPGRMLDLLKRKATSLDGLTIFCLDEADEMLSMGFERELSAIREFLPEERQSLLFSATVTEHIKSVAADLLFYPEFISFSSDAGGAEEIEHSYYLISGIGRLQDLQRVIQVEEPEAAIVFCNTKDDTFRVSNFLKGLGYDADVLNGDLPQKERMKVMGSMKAGELRFLVATDIAARGIDVAEISHFINYVLPESAESYVHRTGRTGRAGKKGEAISLISPKEIGMFYQLRRAYGFELRAKELPSEEVLATMKERKALEDILAGLDAKEELDYGAFLTFVDSFAELPDYPQRLAKLLSFFVTYKEGVAEALKGFEKRFSFASSQKPKRESRPAEPAAEVQAEPESDDSEVEEAPARPRRTRQRRVESAPAESKPAKVDSEDSESSNSDRNGDGRRGRNRRRGSNRTEDNGSADMERLTINLGSDDLKSTGQLVRLVAELSGMEVSDLGTAKILDDHCWVEVRPDLADDIAEAIHNERVDDHVLRVTR
ncbi:MAG: DEAD/DEAH box helicase [Myxococcales bacterium]|nr:DEAD/DEAH box helicase [Myxococcales bacterium]